MTTKKFSQICNTHHDTNKTHKRQLHIAKNIHNKLNRNKAIITQADKGKTVVIIHEHECHKKVRTFLSENNFETMLRDPTNKYQTHVTKTLKQCDLIFHKKTTYTLDTKEPCHTYTEGPAKAP